MRIGFAQAGKTTVRVHADPKPLDWPRMHRDTPREPDGFDGGDAHTMARVTQVPVAAALTVLALLVFWAFIIRRR
jgi:hypothetical protein